MRKADLLDAMERSGLAYHSIQPNLPGESLYIINDEKTDVQCFLRQSGNCLSITFRGSNSAQDWKTNLTFRKKVVPYGNTASKIRVHTGFLNAYKCPQVRGAIQSRVTKEICKVKITGHSQGAALAVLCAVDLEYNFPDRDYEVILFGSPRVGNRAFQKSYNKRVFKTLRVENGNDIVTKVPFVVMGYRHVGMKYRIGNPRIPGVFTFRTHEPQNYYRLLFR